MWSAEWGRSTDTHLSTIDEVADHWLPEPQPALTRAEVDECAARLARLHEIEGTQGEVLMAFAVTVMHERGQAARQLLRMLRSLEGQA